MPDPYEVRLNQLRKKERDYYRENPPSTLKLIPSLNKNGDIEVSIKGAVVYRDNATGYDITGKRRPVLCKFCRQTFI